MEPPDSELRTCTQCGTSTDRTLKFCMVCGAKPEEPKGCVSCHALVDKNLKFCMKCGTRVELPPEVEKTCTSCGVSLDKSLKFCMVCGTKAPTDFKTAPLPAAPAVKAKVPARAAPRRITETAASPSSAVASSPSVVPVAAPSPKPRPVKPPPSKPAPLNNSSALTSSSSPSSSSPPASPQCEEGDNISTHSKLPISATPLSFDTDLSSPSAVTPAASTPLPLPIDRAPSRPAPKKRLPPPPVITATTTFTTLTTTPILSPTVAAISSIAADSYLPPPPPEPETLPLPSSDDTHEFSPLPSPSREHSPSESRDVRTPTHEIKRDTTRSPSRDRNRAGSSDKHRDTRSPSSGDKNRDSRSESNRSDSNNSKVRSESTASKSESLTRENRAETLTDKTRDSRSPTLEMHLREIRSSTIERKSGIGAYGFASFDAAVLPRGSVSALAERSSSSEAPPSPSALSATAVAAPTAACITTATATATTATTATATATTATAVVGTTSFITTTAPATTTVNVAVDVDSDNSSHHKRAESEDSVGGGGGIIGSPTMGSKSLREKRLAMQRTLKARGTLKATENTPIVVETLVLNDAFIPVPTINSTEELMQYVEDKFAHGKLVKDPDSLGQFFSFLHRPKASGFLHFCPPEHVPRVFHHCIMGAFREKSVLQELVRGGQWKQWLVPLLTENTELLDYVIVVIVAAYDYVFHTFSEELSGVPIDKDVAAKERSRDAAKEAARALRRLEAAKKTELAPPVAVQDSRMMTDEVITRPKSLSVAIRASASTMNLGLSSEENCELLPLGLVRDKDLCYCDFLADALSYVTMCTKVEYTFQLLASLMLKLGSWTAAKPPWALPIVAMVEWQNLFSMLEVLEDVTFFQENIKNATVGTAKKPTKEFVMPRLELKSMPAVEACIALLQKLKVSEISAVPDPDPTVFKLQQHYTRVGIQELSFFREVRDFFLLHGARVNRLIVMAEDASDQIAAKFVSTLTSRKRNYGGKAQVKLKVSQYVTRCENALKLSEKRGTDVEAKSMERASISEGTVELGWFANSHKEKGSTTPASESRTLFARTTSDSKRDRAPSDNALGSFSNGDNLAAPPSPESVVRVLPLLED